MRGARAQVIEDMLRRVPRDGVEAAEVGRGHLWRGLVG